MNRIIINILNITIGYCCRNIRSLLCSGIIVLQCILVICVNLCDILVWLWLDMLTVLADMFIWLFISDDGLFGFVPIPLSTDDGSNSDFRFDIWLAEKTEDENITKTPSSVVNSDAKIDSNLDISDEVINRKMAETMPTIKQDNNKIINPWLHNIEYVTDSKRGSINFSSFAKYFNHYFHSIPKMFDWFNHDGYVSFYSRYLKQYNLFSFLEKIKAESLINSIKRYFSDMMKLVRVDFDALTLSESLQAYSRKFIQSFSSIGINISSVWSKFVLSSYVYGLGSLLFRNMLKRKVSSTGKLKFNHVVYSNQKADLGLYGSYSTKEGHKYDFFHPLNKVVKLMNLNLLVGISTDLLLRWASGIIGVIELNITPFVKTKSENTVLFSRDGLETARVGSAAIRREINFKDFTPTTVNQCVLLLLLFYYPHIICSHSVLLSQLIYNLILPEIEKHCKDIPFDMMNIDFSWNVIVDYKTTDVDKKYNFTPFALSHFFSSIASQFNLDNSKVILGIITSLLLFTEVHPFMRVCDVNILVAFRKFTETRIYDVVGYFDIVTDDMFLNLSNHYSLFKLWLFMRLYLGMYGLNLPLSIYQLDNTVPMITESYEYIRLPHNHDFWLNMIKFLYDKREFMNNDYTLGKITELKYDSFATLFKLIDFYEIAPSRPQKKDSAKKVPKTISSLWGKMGTTPLTGSKRNEPTIKDEIIYDQPIIASEADYMHDQPLVHQPLKELINKQHAVKKRVERDNNKSEKKKTIVEKKITKPASSITVGASAKKKSTVITVKASAKKVNKQIPTITYRNKSGKLITEEKKVYAGDYNDEEYHQKNYTKTVNGITYKQSMLDGIPFTQVLNEQCNWEDVEGTVPEHDGISELPYEKFNEKLDKIKIEQNQKTIDEKDDSTDKQIITPQGSNTDEIIIKMYHHFITLVRETKQHTVVFPNSEYFVSSPKKSIIKYLKGVIAAVKNRKIDEIEKVNLLNRLKISTVALLDVIKMPIDYTNMLPGKYTTFVKDVYHRWVLWCKNLEASGYVGAKPNNPLYKNVLANRSVLQWWVNGYDKYTTESEFNRDVWLKSMRKIFERMYIEDQYEWLFEESLEKHGVGHWTLNEIIEQITKTGSNDRKRYDAMLMRIPNQFGLHAIAVLSKMIIIVNCGFVSYNADMYKSDSGKLGNVLIEFHPIDKLFIKKLYDLINRFETQYNVVSTESLPYSNINSETEVNCISFFKLHTRYLKREDILDRNHTLTWWPEGLSREDNDKLTNIYVNWKSRERYETLIKTAHLDQNYFNRYPKELESGSWGSLRNWPHFDELIKLRDELRSIINPFVERVRSEYVENLFATHNITGEFMMLGDWGKDHVTNIATSIETEHLIRKNMNTIELDEYVHSAVITNIFVGMIYDKYDDNKPMDNVVFNIVLVSNNQQAKDEFMAELYDCISAQNVLENKTDMRFVIKYTNITTMKVGGIFSDTIYNPYIAQYDLPEKEGLYYIPKLNTTIKVDSVMKFMNSTEDIRNYHYSHEYKINYKIFDDLVKSGRTLDYFQNQADWHVKQFIFNVIFKNQYKLDNYEQLDKWSDEYKYNYDNVEQIMKSVIMHESGRTKGFLHDAISGKERLIRQVESMTTKQIATPINAMVNELSLIDKPKETSDSQLLANALMSMPLNTSSGHGGKTAGQYLVSLTPEELLKAIPTADRTWRTKIRTDQGAKQRFAYVREIIVRIVDYMSLGYVYKWLKRQEWTSMKYNLYTLSKKFEQWEDKNYHLMSLDFTVFDSKRSYLDVLHTKLKLGINNVFWREHIKHEAYAYPLVLSGKVNSSVGPILIDRADRLMSGDYLTSFYGTMWQRSWVLSKLIALGAVEHMSIGDDLVVAFDRNRNVTLPMVAKIAEDDQSPIAIGKSVDNLVQYNRRIWKKEQYPANNPFTILNSIYRKELQEFEVTLNQIDDRKYDVYIGFLTWMVRMLVVENGYQCIDRLYADLKPRLTLELYDINYKVKSEMFERVEPRVYPMLEELSHYMKVEEYALPIYNIFNVDPKTMIAKYATNPYVDIVKDIAKKYNEGDICVIDTGDFDKFRMDRMTEVSYWLKDRVDSKLFNNLEPWQVTWLDVCARLSLPIHNTGLYRYRNGTDIAVGICLHMKKMWAGYQIHDSNHKWIQDNAVIYSDYGKLTMVEFR